MDILERYFHCFVREFDVNIYNVIKFEKIKSTVFFVKYFIKMANKISNILKYILANSILILKYFLFDYKSNSGNDNILLSTKYNFYLMQLNLIWFMLIPTKNKIYYLKLWSKEV